MATLSKDEVRALAAGERSQGTLAVLYAPWCPFCQVRPGHYYRFHSLRTSLRCD